MRCPYCKNVESRVVDSRVSGAGDEIRRRRECEKCRRRFTTYEKVEKAVIMVVKRDKRREEYQRAKVLAGLRKAFEKRPFSQEDIERIADNVEAKIFDRNEREIASTQIGSIIMDELEGVDGVAYVRFASVYRKFEDVSEFMKELKDILDGKEQAGRKKR